MIGIWAVGGRNGHAIRAISLARRLPQAMVASYVHWEEPWQSEGVTRIEPRHLYARIETLDALVIDTFPLGLDSGLTEIVRRHPVPLVFIYRHVKAGSVDFAPVADFDLVINAEPGPLHGVNCWPILCRERQELDWGDRSGTMRVYDRGPWPLVETLPRYQQVVGFAGYNLFWETQLAECDATWSYRNTRYDDQRWRAEFQGQKINDTGARAAAAYILALTRRHP
jgi:hypothetical protein